MEEVIIRRWQGGITLIRWNAETGKYELVARFPSVEAAAKAVPKAFN